MWEALESSLREDDSITAATILSAGCLGTSAVVDCRSSANATNCVHHVAAPTPPTARVSMLRRGRREGIHGDRYAAQRNGNGTGRATVAGAGACPLRRVDVQRSINRITAGHIVDPRQAAVHAVGLVPAQTVMVGLIDC